MLSLAFVSFDHCRMTIAWGLELTPGSWLVSPEDQLAAAMAAWSVEQGAAEDTVPRLRTTQASIGRPARKIKNCTVPLPRLQDQPPEYSLLEARRKYFRRQRLNISGGSAGHQP